MAITKAKKPKSKKAVKSALSADRPELDSVYFLKILLYLILGSIWLVHDQKRMIPVGLILGVILVQHDRLMIDRKVEYAALLIAALIGLSGTGISLVF